MKDESGATAIEYGLIAGARSLGGTLNSTFSNVNTELDANNDVTPAG